MLKARKYDNGFTLTNGSPNQKRNKVRKDVNTERTFKTKSSSTHMDMRDKIYKYINIKIQCKITDFIKCKRELIASSLATCNLKVLSIRKVTTLYGFSSKIQKPQHATAIYTT